MSRLVNVSHRVPMRGNGSAGGLAIGIRSAMGSSGGLWFGWNGETVPGEPAEAEITIREGITYATVPLPQHLYDRHYSGFANGSLWPLFRYFLEGFRYEDHEYTAYREANVMFARKLVDHLRPSDRIWVHDYQLIPLGEELRALGVKQRVGFFLHVPFPHFEVLRALPNFAEIVRALLAYDLVGFQTETGDDPAKMHPLMARSLDEIILEIGHIQSAARSKSLRRPLPWPVLVVCTPSGWAGPKSLQGQAVEGTFRAHQMPLPEARSNPAQLAMLEAWLRSYRPGELFDRNGKLHSELADLAPRGVRRMGNDSHAIGGAALRDCQ